MLIISQLINDGRLDGQFMHSDVDGVTGSGFLGDVSFIQSQGTFNIYLGLPISMMNST